MPETSKWLDGVTLSTTTPENSINRTLRVLPAPAVNVSVVFWAFAEQFAM